MERKGAVKNSTHDEKEEAMGRGKRFLSLFLAAALVVTGVNIGTPTQVNAAETISTKYYQEVTGTMWGSGTQSSDTTVATVATTGNPDENGSESAAPYIVGETASSGGSNWGGVRIGCLQFKLPDNMDLSNLKSAKVTLNIQGINNVEGSDQFTSVALYQTNNPASPTTTDASTYTARNKDYSKAAAIWGDKKLSKGVTNSDTVISSGEVKFDVTDALKQAYTDNTGNMVLRVQTPRAGFYIYNENSSYPPVLTIDATTDKSVTVNYVDKDGKSIKESKIVSVKLGSVYSYDVTEDEKVIITEDGKIYKYVSSNTLTEVTASDLANVINLVYEEVTISEQSGKVELVTRVGIAPELPEKVEASFSDFSTDNVDVTWNEVTADKYAAAGSFDVTGTFTGTDVEVKGTVTVKEKDDYLLAKYTFDDDTMSDSVNSEVSERNATKDGTGTITSVDGLSGKAISLPGGTKGTAAIKLAEDLLTKNGVVQDDITISMFLNRGYNGNSFAWTLCGTDTSNYFGLMNNDVAGQNARGLCMDFKKKGKNSASTTFGKHYTNQNEWVHVAVVFKGSAGVCNIYQNGELVETKEGIEIKPSDFTQGNNWLGRSVWSDSDYASAYDEVAVYGEALTEAEVKDICDSTLYEAQIAKTKDALAITSADESVSYDKDNVTANLTLPTTGAGYGTTVAWASDNEEVVKKDGTVIRPSKTEGDASVTLTATITAGSYSDTKTFQITVKAMEGINFDGLTLAISNAEATYAQAVKENIYTADSLKTLSDAIAAAKVVEAEKDNADSEITTEQVKDATTTLEAAEKNSLILKNFDEINKELTAWYPLTDDANDATANGNNGVATDKVTFSRENGATFVGDGKLASYISLPTTMFDGKDQLTVSFWAKDDGTAADRNQAAFGFGSGTNGDGNNSEDVFKYVLINTNAKSKLKAVITTNTWRGEIGYADANVDFAKNTWSHITCVFNGTKFTVYKDGVLVGEKDTGICISDLGTNRVAYIGNSIWGNNDNDYIGSVKDFRIYNASLAAEQVKAVYDYAGTLPMEYAKSDLIEAMGATVEKDGTVTLNVTNLTTQDGVLTLPATSYQDAAVVWTSGDDNIINATTGAAALPAVGEANKTVDLTAAITVNGKTENVVFKCTLFTRLDIDTTELETVIAEAEALTETDYTAGSWAALETALDTAKKQAAQPTSEGDVAEAKSALQAAMNNLVDKSQLDEAIAETANFDENDYTTSSWSALQTALTEAKAAAANGDADQETIDDACQALSDAIEALDIRGDKEQLNALIAEVEELKEENYTVSSWSALQTALTEAKAAADSNDVNQGAVDIAKNALAEAKGALVDISKLNEEIQFAEEVVSVNKEKYTVSSWNTYQGVLEAAKEIAGKADATAKEIEDILSELAVAGEALATRGDTTELEALILQADALAEADYTAESWSVLQTALTEAKKIVADKENADEEIVKTAKEDLETAIAGLKAAEKEPAVYTVTFKNGTAVTTVKVTEGGKVKKPADPKKTGYKFGGWFAAGSTKAFDFNTVVTGNVTLTAKWVKLTSISSATVKVAKAAYTGKVQKPKVTVTYKGKTLKLNRDYKVAYGSYKKVGKAQVKITGIGNYTGTKTVSYNIIPNKNKITKITNVKGKKLTVKFSKATSVKGYEISYATSSSFKGAKKVKTTKTSVTLKSLKKNKTYYVRVRSYTKIGTKTVYSDYSPVVKKKVTK